jgi:POT family proton-dependent oligopeptide transporter
LGFSNLLFVFWRIQKNKKPMATKTQHPKGLMVLFFTEMWERFSFYGMRALLVLYLTAEMIGGGFGLERGEALKIYAIFTMMVYLTPIPGGFLADKFLGQRKAVFIGAILMAIGHFFMAYSQFGEEAFRLAMRNNGLGLIIVGTGFLKANISTIVGQLYESNDPRKDSGFTLFYMGINIGAFAGPILAGFLGEKIDWYWGFISAGIGMLLGTLWFYFQRSKLEFAGMPPGRKIEPGSTFYKLTGRDRIDIAIYVVLNVLLVAGFLFLWRNLNEVTRSIIVWSVCIIGGGFLILIIIQNTQGKVAWSKMSVLLILALFNIFFWSGYEQAGGTFNLFASENTNRMTFLGEFPATWLLAVPALFVVVFAGLFAAMWIRLHNSGRNPRTPVKFAIGLLFMSVGFLIISIAANLAEERLVGPIWLIGTYLMHVLGELCLSPIGLSIVTKLSPQRIVSIMMGIWFASIAVANLLAGLLEGILHKFLPNMHVFVFLTISTLVGGLLALALSPVLNRMMKGVH